MFPFLTGAGKIKTDADVAYLFRCLENSAIENAFAVLVGKDGRPLIVHIGMGTSNMSTADMTAIRRAMDAYETSQFYFVHNHPSGNLRPSPQDQAVLRKIEEMLGEEIDCEGIIIDVTSGKYSTFATDMLSGDYDEDERPQSAKGKEREHGVLAFSRQAYAADYNPENLMQIRKAEDVAAFVSSRRLGEGVKLGYILLSRANKIIGNMHSSHTDYSDARGLADEITRMATAHGAEGVILYGNARLDRMALPRLKDQLDRQSGKGLRMLDAMRIDNGLSEGYESAQENGVLEPLEEYGIGSPDASENGIRFRMRENEPPKKTQKVYKLMRLENGRLYPLFIDSAAPTELGVWYDADSPNLDMLRRLPAGTYIINQETGETQSREEWNAEHPELASETKYPKKGAIDYATANGLRWIQIEDTEKGQRRFGGESRRYWNLGVNGSGSVSTFSMRPGWHAGSLPTMRQIGKGKNKDLRDDRFVWVEGEVSADKDYNAEAQQNPDKDLPDRIPEDGFYMKATNADKAKSQADRVGWYVAGAFRANRIISDAEAREIIDAHNAEHPDAPVEYDYKRESGIDFVPTEGMNRGAIYTREGDGAYSDEELSNLNDPWYKASWGEASRSKKQQARFAERMRRAMRDKIAALTGHLKARVDVEIIEDSSKLEGRKRTAKGWFDPRTGKICIVLGNHSSTLDIQATLLHEMVAHKGLRDLFGERFDAFLDAVYANAEDRIKEQIDVLAIKNGWNRRVATEEYLAGLAEDASFADIRGSWWQKLKALFMDFLRGCGFSANVKISDNELRYVLWMSWKNLQEPGAFRTFLGMAEKVVKEDQLKVGEYAASGSRPQHSENAAEPLFRDGDFTPRDRVMAAAEYEDMLRRGSFQFREATQDSMLGLKKLYQAILGKGTRIEDVAGYENAYLYENRMSSANNGEQAQYFSQYMKPLLKSVYALCGKDELERRILTDYMMAKHGLERNEYMRNEAAAAGEATERDFAGLCGLTGKKDWKDAEAEAQKMIDDYEATHDLSLINQLWSDTKRATGATLEKIYLTGLISEDTYNKVLGMYDYYIPLRGWDETTSDEVYGYLTSPDGPLLGSVWKHAEGRESKADDPIATIAKMADDAIRQGNRNVMKQRFLNFAQGNPSDLVSVSQLWLQHNDVTDEWEAVFADLEPDMTPAEIERELKLFEEKMEALAAAEPDKYKRGRDARNIPYKVVNGNLKEHQVLAKRNGHTYVMTINGNPRAAQALNGLTNPNVEMGGVIGNMLKLGEYVNRNLSAFYTTRNPDFVVSNFLRDMLYSNCMTWVKENPRYALRFHKNFARVNPASLLRLLSKWESNSLSDGNYLERMFKEFMLNGGETGYTSVKDIEGHKRDIAKELKKQGNAGRKAWAALGKQLDLLNRCAENCARFAAFLTSREMGRTLDRSIYDAKEISVNFNKKGSGGKFVNATGQTKLGKIGSYIGGGGRIAYVFWNAGVQGMTNFGRAGLRNPKKALAGAAALFTLGTVIPLLAQLLGGGDGDDDDKNAYYNLPEYVRRSNICFKAGDQWITIPLPIEYRAIYGMGELATGVISGNERYSNSELARQMAAQVSQIMPLDMLEGGGGIAPFIPSAFKPMTEAYIMNKGWTGLPVYKDTPFNKNDPEWTKAYASADQHLVGFAKWLNETSGGDNYKKGAIDINPAKLEYLLNGTFGGMMTFPMKVKKGLIETPFGDRDFEWRNMPIANRVVKSGDERTANRKLQNEYFKYKSEADKTATLLKKYENAADEGILGYAEKADFLYNSKEYLRYEIFEEYKPDIDAIREEMKGETDPKQKKELEAELFQTMRELVDELHEAGK